MGGREYFETQCMDSVQGGDGRVIEKAKAHRRVVCGVMPWEVGGACECECERKRRNDREESYS